MSGGRLVPRFYGMTGAERSSAAALFAAAAPTAAPLVDRDGLELVPCADGTGARLLLVRSPWREGSVRGSFYGGRWSGGPRHDDAARVWSAAAGVPRALLVCRWDAESGGTVSLYRVPAGAL